MVELCGQGDEPRCLGWVEEKTGSRLLGATAAAATAVGDAIVDAPEADDYVKDNVTLDPDEIDWDRTLKPWKWL